MYKNCTIILLLFPKTLDFIGFHNLPNGCYMEGRKHRVVLVNSHAIANACNKYGLASLKSILGADVSLSAPNIKQ